MDIGLANPIQYTLLWIKYSDSVWTDARKIFVNPKKRIVKFEFVTFGPMRE